ncbi:MAG: YybH family protein [Vicinamibacterales bacterium]
MPNAPASARVAVAIAVAALLAAPVWGRQGNVRAAIEAANKKFVDGAAKGDAKLIATVYTTDAEAFPPNADVVRGRDAIQKLWQSVLDSGVSGVELKTREADASGDTAWESGGYTMSAKDGKVLDRGKYCVIWKRVQGQWLLHRDIWNSSVPAGK